MVQVTDLKSLKEFVKDRPNLKVKVDEVMEIVGISDYNEKTSPIVDRVSIYGCNDYYDDNGKPKNNAFVSNSQILQEIYIDFYLINQKRVEAKINQKKRYNKVTTRANYSTGFNGIKGKADVSEMTKDLIEKVNKNENPFEKELSIKKNVVRLKKENVEKAKVELELLNTMGEELSLTRNLLKNSMHKYEYELSKAEMELVNVENKYKEVEEKMGKK